MRFLITSTLAVLLASSACGQSTLSSFSAVQTDLKALFSDSQTFWPADFNNYGPFFVRLAWHCSGSYRISDGRGGCDGARQRFDPERSWDDNTNLDKARKLLQPVKLKYGDALSWGDLIVLAGTTAIQNMGGPVLGFCGGRIDDMDGTASQKLGPTAEQQVYAPCTTNGECTSPIGTTTIGLIYVNPEGPMGNPDPVGSAPQVRDTFARMAMNDSETVALIGGGHAFGKTHGACDTGPGPAPDVQPENSWPGTCGNGTDSFGKGIYAYTSGFEGPWTTTPTQWSNEFFTNLNNFDWNVTVGPGGKHQWHADGHSTIMLTTDVSLLYDSSFHSLVNQYATDIDSLSNDFKHAWYKLVSRDMGPHSRCIGDLVPSPQNFQYPLPDPPSTLPDWNAVRNLITFGLESTSTMVNSLIRLTYQSCSTFRQTDYLGGCNGARIRFSPQNTWSVNAGISDVSKWLQDNVMSKYTGSGTLTHADLFVFAGQVAVETAASNAGYNLMMSFCPGRSDASDGSASEYLTPTSFNESDVLTTLIQVRDEQEKSGLSPREFIVLFGRPRLAADQESQGYSGTWKETSKLSHSYFKVLLNYTWSMQNNSNGKVEYFANEESGVYITPFDAGLIYDAEYLAIVQEYAANNTLFLNDFAATWTKLVNMDRFSGPTGNLCSGKTAYSLSEASSGTTSSRYVQRIMNVGQDAGIWIFVGVFAVIAGGFLYIRVSDGAFPGCAK